MICHAFVSGDDVAVGESSHVSNVKVSGDSRVGEVDEEFLFMFSFCFVYLIFEPFVLPFLFAGDVVVLFCLCILHLSGDMRIVLFNVSYPYQ